MCLSPERAGVCLQDGVKLAQAVQGAGGAAASPAVLAEALRSFERERTARSTPVAVKSRFMGALLQIRNPWVGLSQLPPSVDQNFCMQIISIPLPTPVSGSMCLAYWQV